MERKMLLYSYIKTMHFGSGLCHLFVRSVPVIHYFFYA